MQATDAAILQDQGIRFRSRSGFGNAVHWTWMFIRTKPLGAIGAFIIIVMLFAALFAPWITQYDYRSINPRERLETPSTEHWFGTDQLGRDFFARIVYGARVSLFVGFVGTVIGVGVG
jgi:ABC-type dipeptide/oligopeptide/nickel transport system permease subunit